MPENQLTSQAPAAVVTQPAFEEEETIDLVELFLMLLHHWKSILLAFLIGATLLAAYHTFFVKPRYSASAEMYITSSDSVISLQDLQIGSALTSDYQSIITSRSVLNQVIDDLQLNTNYKGLKSLVSVSNPSGTHIIHISVTTSDLTLSRDIANSLLTVSIERIYQIVGTGEPTVIDYSQAEAVEDVTPGMVKYVAIGGFVAVILVMAFYILRMLMDNTIKSDDDVQKYLQLPVLAAVPYFKN